MFDFASMFPQLFQAANQAQVGLGPMPEMTPGPQGPFANQIGGLTDIARPGQAMGPNGLMPGMAGTGGMGQTGGASLSPIQSEFMNQLQMGPDTEAGQRTSDLTPEQMMMMQKMMPGQASDYKPLPPPGTFGRPQVGQMQQMQLPQQQQPMQRRTLAQLIYGR